tara:strand:+ start:1217 stop:2446 length:1230 start_codon:yes stop_codon:yes gene_type:complete
MTHPSLSRIFKSIIFSLLFFFVSLTQISFSQDVDLGAQLFKANCASCHYLGPEEKKLIGPGLSSEIFEEYSLDWLYSWIRNSSELIESGDKQAVEIYEEYNKAVMTAFTHFSDTDIDNILAYIEQGPQELTATSTESSLVEDNSSASTTSLYLILVLIVFNVILLLYVKNTLKVAAGIEQTRFFQSGFNWVKHNPSVIVFASILFVFSGMKGCWNSLSTIGVAQNYQPEQPIAFSHKIHAGEQGIDCNYCHHTARDSKHAGIPSLNVCMNCHTYINEGTVSGKEEINKIYAAVGFDPNTRTYIPGYEEKPVEWVRIHNLPDLAYFNHSQHVNVAGVECQTCHGPIEEMDEVYQYSKLTMGWCINCHRETEIDTENPYYHDVHDKWIDKYHGEDITVDMIGGRECAKCHY